VAQPRRRGRPRACPPPGPIRPPTGHTHGALSLAQDHLHRASRGAAQDRSPRRKPWVKDAPPLASPRGAKEVNNGTQGETRGWSRSMPPFLSPLQGWRPSRALDPRLTPWAKVFRRSGLVGGDQLRLRVTRALGLPLRFRGAPPRGKFNKDSLPPKKLSLFT